VTHERGNTSLWVTAEGKLIRKMKETRIFRKTDDAGEIWETTAAGVELRTETGTADVNYARRSRAGAVRSTKWRSRERHIERLCIYLRELALPATKCRCSCQMEKSCIEIESGSGDFENKTAESTSCEVYYLPGLPFWVSNECNSPRIFTPKFCKNPKILLRSPLFHKVQDFSRRGDDGGSKQDCYHLNM